MGFTNLNFSDAGNLEKLYEIARLMPFLEDINFIKNYKKTFCTARKLAGSSIFLTKRHVEDYQREVWENISRPFDELFQHYDTLLSLMDRLNEVFLTQLLQKTFSQSKILFTRKYGREISPIIQMIASEDLNDKNFNELKLPKNLHEVYKTDSS